MLSPIPFTRPYVAGSESRYVQEVIRTGRLASDGPFTRRCVELLESRFGIRKILLTPSCTAALEMAAMLCEVGPQDEVILPSYTFVSTANAVVLRGAKPVFVDIRPDTLNLDEALLEEAITDRTKAIFAVHYAGVSCNMERILTIGAKYGLRVVEDAAQGVNAFYGEKALGSLGDLGAFSFHETKNYVCGEGGALCVNNPELIERAEIIREKGTDRSKFLRGQVDKYTWVDLGSSYLPSELSAAFLLGQLEQLDEINARRQQVFDFYQRQLRPLEVEGLVRLPIVPDDCRANAHMFYLLTRDQTTRDGLLAHLKQQGISAVFHYVPLHTSPLGQKLGYRAGELPVTEDLSGRLIRLPLFCDISEEERMRVVEAVAAYFAHAGQSSRRASSGAASSGA